MTSKTYDEQGNVVEVPESIETARRASFEQIQKRAILVDLKRRQFSNMPFDQSATKAVAASIGANEEQLQVRKFLIKPEYLSAIRNVMNDASLLVINHTRPWENVGPRVLPMAYYDDFTEAFGQAVDEFEVELQKLEANWDKYVAEARKNLGPKVFNKKDYPTSDQLKEIFHLSIETSEFPNIDDIRLGLGGQELLEMQKDVAEKYTDANAAAFEVALEGARNAKTPETVDKFVTLAELLNVEENPELEMKLTELREELKDVLSKVDAQEESMMVMDDIDGMDDIDMEAPYPANDPNFTPGIVGEPEVETEDDDDDEVDFDNLI